MDREEREQMLAEFGLYQDRFGLQGIQTDGTKGHQTQNGVLFTAEYLVAVGDDLPILELQRALRAVWQCEVKPGLMHRNPESQEYDSMDNLCAVLALSILHRNIALPDRIRDHGLGVKCQGLVTSNVSPIDQKVYRWLRILKLGGMPKNYWNNLEPEKFNFYSWFGRSPGMMGLIDIAATGNTTMFRKFALMVGQFLGCFQPKENTDARKLPYVVWQALKLRGGLWALGYKLWTWKLMRDYPRGMKDVYQIYYGPDYPLVKYSPAHRE